MGKGLSIPPKKFRAWEIKSDNTVYRAASDGFVCANTPNGSTVITGFTDPYPINPPTTARQYNYANGGAPKCGINFEVLKGDYWKVTGGTDSVFWIANR